MTMSVDGRNLGRVVAASAIAAGALQVGAALVATSRGRRDYADAVWGPGLAAIAVTSAAVGTGDPWRRWTLAAVTGAWAVRLERLMIKRLRGSDTEDPRYTEFLAGDSATAAVLKVFATQGLAQVLVSAPIQVAAASRLPGTARRWLFPAGIAVMVSGALTEALADRQKARYMDQDEGDRPDVLDTGLWAWSRHPNYFGDSVVWDGAWIAAAASAPGPWTIPGPIVMSYLLIFATGAKRTRAQHAGTPFLSRIPAAGILFRASPPALDLTAGRAFVVLERPQPPPGTGATWPTGGPLRRPGVAGRSATPDSA